MAKRKRRLRDIEVDEVSFVDHPANQKPFLFWKRNGEVDIDKKDLDLKVVLETKGSPENTSISVNGSKLDNPVAFSLYYYPIGTDNVSVACEYGIASKGETNGGFASTRHYRLSKNAGNKEDQGDADEVDIEVLKDFIGPVDEMSKDLAHVLADRVGIIKTYIEDCPADLVSAVRDVVKLATSIEVEDIDEKEVEKMADEKGEAAAGATEKKPDQEPKAFDIDELVGKLTESLDGKIAASVKAALEAQSAADKKAKDEAADPEVSEEETQAALTAATQEGLEEGPLEDE